VSTYRFETVQDYDNAIYETVALIEKGERARTTITAELDTLVSESRLRDLRADHRAADRRRDQLELSLRQIETGFGRDDGYFPPVAHLFPYLGLAKLREELAHLTKERDALGESLRFDPTVTRPYRIVPIKPGSNRKALNLYWYFGDVLRKVVVGDVIRLNAKKAKEYADCLEPVEESAAPDTPEATPVTA